MDSVALRQDAMINRKSIADAFRSLLLVALGLLLLQDNAIAQFDYKFWMPPIWQTSDALQNSPSELFITTPYPTAVNVHVETPDGTTFVFNGTVVSGTPLIIPLTPSIGQTNLPNTAMVNNGLIVTTNRPVQCVHRVSAVFNQTLVTLKGRNALGRDFWCGSQVRNNTSGATPNAFHFISVMALEDNTVITIATPGAQFSAPNPNTIILNSNQSYLVRTTTAYQTVSGSHVTSNKDIVVISGSTHTPITGGSTRDGGTDQLVPLPLVGIETAAIKGQNTGNADYIIVVGTEANTQIFIDGSVTPAATINAGQTFDWTMTGSLGSPHYFRTSKPAFVYHVAGASPSTEVDMALLPQLDCTGSRYIEFSRFTVNTTNQVLQVLAGPNAWPTVRLNGVLFSSVSGVIVNTVPGLTGWRAITFPNSAVPADCVLNSNGFFHAAWLTGTGTSTAAYGYLSGFDDAFEFLDPQTNLPTNIYNLGQICQGESEDHCIRVVSCVADVELSSFAGNVGTVFIAPPSSPFDSCFRYTAPFNFVGNDTITFTATNMFGYEDDMEIVFQVVNPDTPIDAGANQQICDVSTTTLSAVNPDPLATGFWTVAQGTGILTSPNSPTTGVTNLSLGANAFIWHQLYSSCNVENVDIVQVFRFQGFPPNANAGPDANLCGATSYTMQANNPGFSGIGTWEILSGNGTIFNINSATAVVSNLGLGVNTFRWNITNGPCPGADTNDLMVINVFNPNHPAANAGPDQTVCQGTFAFLSISANSAQVPATGQWSVISGSATFANQNAAITVVSALGIGLNVLRWTINNGPCGTLTDNLVITVFSPTSPAANAGPDQTVCLPSNSATLAANTPTFPATGTWSVVAGTGSFSNLNSPTAIVSGLSLGTNTFRWTASNGPCLNSMTQDLMTILVYPASQPTVDAGANQQVCFTGSPLSTVLNGSALTFPGTGQWTVVNGSGVFSAATSSTTSVSGLGLGTNTFQWTVTNGPCGSPINDQMVVTVFNAGIPAANAGPDAQVCTPVTSYTMQGVAPVFPATGVWSVISGSGVFANSTSSTTQVSNLGIGTNVFRWTILNGPCAAGNFDEVTVTLFNANIPVANAGADQQSCFTGAIPVVINLSGNIPSAPATGTWSLVSGGGSISNPASPTSSVIGLPIGVSVFQWTFNNGICGSSSDQVSITVFNPNQTSSSAGPDQSICSNVPSVSLSANPLLVPATGQWTVVSGSGVFSSATSSNTTVSGLSFGINVFQWTINNGPCSTPANLADQVAITVFNNAQAPANAGADQSICSTITSVSMSGNSALLPAFGAWSVIAGTGTFVNANSPVTSVSGLSIGLNTFRWTINNGPCGAATTDDVTITVFDQNAPAANAGLDQALCLPLTAVTMAGNAPLFPATAAWTVTSGSGTITTPSSATTTITNLSIGSSVFTWTINNGSCGIITSDAVSVFLFDIAQELPNAGPDASLCTPQSTYVMQGSAVTFPATGSWSLISGTGTISNPNNPAASISGLGVGTNVFRWTISNGPCPDGFNTDNMSIFVFDQNQANANAGPDQFFCFTGISPVNATMAASAIISPGSGLWILVSGSGTIAVPNSPTTVISNLGVGENIFRWTSSNGPCANGVTSDLISIFVYPGNQPAANAGGDQELCSTGNATVLSANSVVFPATGQWIVVQGTGVLANSNSPNTPVSGLGIGVNIFQWTITNGPCVPNSTSDQVTITVFNVAQLPADAGSGQSICNTQSEVTLTGSAFVAPASALWQVVSGSGTIASASASSTTVSGLSLGVNVFSYTLSNGPCAAPTTDQVVITVFDSEQPVANAGLDQSQCLPQTTVNLNGNQAVFPATGLWTIVSGSGSINSPTSASTTVDFLPVGSHTFQWTITNGPCGPSVSADQVTVLVFDTTQADANAGADQSFCEPISSTGLAGNAPIFPATGTWQLISGTGVVSNPTLATSQVTGLSVGENIFEWTINNGPCPDAVTSDQVSIFIFDNDQIPANAGPDQSFCSPAPTATVIGNSPIFPSTGLWELLSGTGSIADATLSTTTISGLSIGENQFSWSISNGPCANSSTIDVVSLFVYDTNAPAADAGSDQSICAPVSTVLMDANAAIFPGFGTWELVSGTGFIQETNNPLSEITNLAVGENIFRWTIDNGGCGFGTTSDLVTIFVYSDFSPNAFAGEDQDLCTPQTSTVFTGNFPIFPAFGEWILISGTGVIADPSNPNSPVSGLGIGPNVFEWTIFNGPCQNSTTSDQVTMSIFDGAAASPFAGNDQELCSPDFTTQLEADPAVFPGLGTWSVIGGTGSFGDPNDPSALVSGLSIGFNVLRWTVNYSTCGSPFDDVSIIVYDSSQGPADAGPDQEICNTVPDAMMQAGAVIAPGYGTWSVFQGSGAITNVNDPLTMVSNLEVGENILVWEIYNGGCLAAELSTDTIAIYVFDDTETPAFAGDDQLLCTPTFATTLVADPIIYPASSVWELLQGTGSIVSPATTTTLVNGLSVGENIFRISVDNGPCPNGTSSDEVSIFLFDENQPAANAGEDQSFCSPVSSTVLEGNALIFPATGSWILLSGTGTITDPTDPQSALTGLSIGENVLQWTISNGPCGIPTFDLVSIFIYDESNPLANAGVDQEICTPQSTTNLQGSSVVFPATGVWTQISGNAVLANPSDPGTLISDLTNGEYEFVWTVSNGPCANSLTTDTVVVRLFATDAPLANAGLDQSWCTPVSTIFMNATVPVIPGVGTWTVESGSANILDANDPATGVDGLSVGEIVLRWTLYNGPCANSNSFDLITILIYDENQPAADAGDDQDLCTPVTSTNMEANNVIFPATGTWTLVNGTGTFADASNPLTLVSDLSVGDNIFQWTISNGPCAQSLTTDQVIIRVFDQGQDAANAGDDVEICLPQNSIGLLGSAVVGSSVGTWTLQVGSGVFANANDPLTIVSDLAQGINTFLWSVDNGSCGSTNDEVSMIVYNPDAPIADAGLDVSFCTPVSTYILQGNTPENPGLGTWIIVSGGASVSDANDPNAEVSGLTIGAHELAWSIYNGPCAEPTTDAVVILIYDENQPEADAGEDQELCAPDNTVTATANAQIFPATGTWTVVEGSGSFSDIEDPVSTITDLPIGENVFEWTINNGPCDDAITSDQFSVFVYDPDPLAANAGVDQFWCSPVSSTVMTATLPTVPGMGTWTLLNGTGTIANINDPGSLVTDLSIGENIFQWTVYNGPCAVTNMIDVVSIFIYDTLQEDADAGPDQQLCTPTTSTQLEANSVVFPATGQWELVQGLLTISDINDPNAIVTDVAPGVNILEWTVNNGSCGSGTTTDQVIISVFNSDQELADAGPDQLLCLPINSTTLTGTILTGAATGQWIVVSGGGNIADPLSSTTEVSDLPQGINVFEWSIDNGSCGVSSDEVMITVSNPDAPAADAGPDASYCTPVSTHEMQAVAAEFPAVGVWTLITGTGFIENINDPNSLITTLQVGENIFLWTVDNGACGVTLDVMSIFIYNETTPNANAGPDQEICLPITSAQMSASPAEFPAIGFWTLVEGSGTVLDVNSPTTGINDLALGTNIFAWTVNNGPCPNGITSDTLEIRVFDPELDQPFAGDDQNICTPISEVVMNASGVSDPNYGFWTLQNGSGVIVDVLNPSTVVSGLAVGVNVLTWIIYNGVCANGLPSDEVIINVFDQNQPPADSGLDQELCWPQSGTTLDANTAIVPALGTWSVVNGAGIFADENDPLTTVSGLEIGTNTFVWSINNGPCENALTADTISVLVFDPGAEIANAGPDFSICTPENCVTLEAIAAANPQTGTWTFVSSINGGGTVPFGSLSNTNDPSAELCALVVGVHTLEWELYNGPCDNNTSDLVTVSVFDATAPFADAGPDQELCGADNSTQLSANSAVFPGVGTWVIVSSPGSAVLSDVNSPAATISGLAIGITTLTWTIDNGPCSSPSTDTVVITVYDPASPDADAGPDQSFCENFPTAVMAANAPLPPAVGTWTIISGGGDIVDVNDPNTEITSIPLNTHIYVWSIYNGACPNSLTTDTLEVFVNDLTVAAADAGPDRFLCGAPESLQLQGSVTVGLATSEWVILSGGGVINNPSNNNPLISGLPIGVTTLQYTVDNGACGISSDIVTITIYDPSLPTADAGPDQGICENEFVTFNLMATEAVFPSLGWWSIEDGPIELSDTTDANALVITLGNIIVPLVDVPSTLVWTIDNGVCGTTSDTLVLVLRDCLTLKIPDAFSPNGDGVNDEWIIPNIDSYPNNTVKIFNRWGTEIYNAAPYTNGNAWNGVSSHPATLGDQLPVSTYYYIVDLGSGEEAFQGFVYLKR